MRFDSLGLLLACCGVKYAVSYLPEIFNKLTKILLNPNFNLYNSKISSANLLKILAEQLQGAVDVLVGFYQDSIIKALEFASKDRVLKVQQAAHFAIKEWRKLKESYKEVESKKMIEDSKGLSGEELIEMRLNNITEDPYPKINTHKDFQPLCEGGRYLKKRMGTGGGYIELEKSPIRRKTPKRESIKIAMKKFIEIKTAPEFYKNPELTMEKNEENTIKESLNL